MLQNIVKKTSRIRNTYTLQVYNIIDLYSTWYIQTYSYYIRTTMVKKIP